MVKEIVEALQNTPIPTILVVAGIVFLLLSVASQLTGGIAVHPERQRQAVIIGSLLLVVGIGLNIAQPRWFSPKPSKDSGVQPPHEPKPSSSGQEAQKRPPPEPGQEIPTKYPDVMARITRFGRSGAFITLEMTVKNGGKKNVFICNLPPNRQLFDQGTGDSWEPVNVGGDLAGCTSLSASEESGLWMQFKIPNPETRAFSLKHDLFNKPVENLVLQ